ncbi:hypothetical protein [Pantoea ananatis]|uniref:hypothetical protein n=1 Tax=Pantoea ananas TaxID=553 RepID=UPI003CF2C602
MLSAILKLLKAEWKTLLLIAVLTGSGIWLGMAVTGHRLSDQKADYEQALRKQEAAFSAERSQWQTEKTDAANRYAASLKAALEQQNLLQAKADALSGQLEKNKRDRQKQVDDLNRRLNDALKHDGSAYTGLGPSGLQLWREALGWSDAGTGGDKRLSEAASGNAAGAGNATVTAGGLSPAGVIKNSAAYGQWCLELRDRLEAINHFYGLKE